MREIKFRAWDNSNKNWLINEWCNDSKHFIIDDFRGPHGPLPIGDAYQFTGLKDKNGVEIYEGDIVVIWDSVRQHAYKKIGNPKGEIVFDEAEFYFKSEDVPYESIAGHALNYRIEVIGNTYKNPELLNGK